eukprot:475053-Pleurochrysis_carterae.AAC.1
MPTETDAPLWELEAPAGVAPAIVAPTDERARAILDGFKMCAATLARSQICIKVMVLDNT